MSVDYHHIVEGCKRHDRRMQRQLYDELAPMCMGVCRRYAGDEAEDMMQEGFVRVFEKIGSLHEAEKLRSWVYSTMVNVCVSHLRKSSRMARLERMEQLPDMGDEGDCEDAFDKYTMTDIVGAMQRLSARHRLVFNLCGVEERGYGEVAAMLGTTEGNVRQMMLRARRELRRILMETK